MTAWIPARLYINALRIVPGVLAGIALLAGTASGQDYSVWMRDPAFAQILTPVLDARSDAEKADAPLYSPATWKRAEGHLEATINSVERGNAEQAAERAQEARATFLAAALESVTTVILGSVRARFSEVERGRARRLAPITLAEAQASLATAERALAENRSDLDSARSLGETARKAIAHAQYMAEAIRASTSGDGSIEKLVREWEAALTRVAEAAGMEIDLSGGPGQPATALAERVTQLRDDSIRLERELDDRNQTIRNMQIQITALEEQLTGVAQERTVLSRELDARQRVREQFQAIEALFDPTEAEVIRDGDDALIRLIGLEFAVGTSKIGQTQHPLLAKVIEAIRIFPSSDVDVEGHTDSRGESSVNMRLSRERARSVRDYVLASGALNAARISSAGYGETRPVASNETSSGRAKNRRIDIRIRPNLSISD